MILVSELLVGREARPRLRVSKLLPNQETTFMTVGFQPPARTDSHTKHPTALTGSLEFGQNRAGRDKAIGWPGFNSTKLVVT